MKTKRRLVLLIAAMLCTPLYACSSSSDSPTNTSDTGSTVTTELSTAQSGPIESSKSVELELSNGNYTAGVDFPEGKYNFVAVSGGGNVSSSNMFDGGINTVMGTEEKNQTADMYQQEYKNVELPNGTRLSVSGVTIRITCDDASSKPLTPRNQTIKDPVELGNGNFIAGEDFPAGVYDIIAISGGGNVSSDNIFDGGINAIMGTEDQNRIADMYQQEYKNIELPEGTRLKINGVNIRLTPSA